MKDQPTGKLIDGARCDVVGGVHKGQSGVVRDIKMGKTGHVSITVVQDDGERFKTLAKNVVVLGAVLRSRMTTTRATKSVSRARK